MRLKNTSLFLWFIRFLIASGLLVFHLSCGTGAKKDLKPLSPKDGYTPAPWTPMTSVGDNHHPSFSPDGKSITYVKGISGTDFPQAYVVDLVSKKETQLTFQKASIYFTQFGPKGRRIYFNSPIDEWIENPPSIRNQSSNTPKIPIEHLTFPESEVYSMSLVGSELRRMTVSEGYDGPLSFEKSNRYALLSSEHKGYYQLHQLDTRRGRKTLLTSSKSHKIQVQLSSDKKHLVWVEIDPKSDATESDTFANTSLITSLRKGLRNARTLEMPMGSHISPQWHPKDQWILFSSNIETPNQRELYIVKPDGKCLQRLTYSHDNELYGEFSSDGRYITFASGKVGSRQVYIMEFKPRSSCPDEKPDLDS